MKHSAVLIGSAPTWLRTPRVRRDIIPRSHSFLGSAALRSHTDGLVKPPNLHLFSTSVTAGLVAHISKNITCSHPADEDLDDVDNESGTDEAPAAQQDELAAKEVHELLLNALTECDIPMVVHAWPKLREMKRLTPGLAPISYTRQYSQLISELDLEGKNLDQNAIHVLDELAASIVVDDAGICSRARHYFNNNDPDAILRIMHMAYSFLQERNFLLHKLQSKASPDEYLRIRAVSGDTYSMHFRCIAYAIAACVMKNSLRPMLGLGLYDNLAGSAMPQLLAAHVRSIAEELALQKTKFTHWVNRFISLHRVASEPTSFAKYVSRIESSSRPHTLIHLANMIVKELSEDEPCLTLNLAAASAVAPEHPLIVLRSENWARLMRGLIRARRVEEAERFWVDMTGLGAKIPVLVWAAVIEGFGGLRMFNRVQVAWNTFCSTQPTSAAGAVVYRAYIIALFGEGRSKDALDIFEAFDKRIRKEPESVESAAVVSVYNAVLEWLVQQSRIAEAWLILERMKSAEPTRPDVASYNIFIQHASRSKDLKAIAGIIREMQALGMTSDVYTASVLLAAVYPVRTDAVELVLSLLRQAGVQVNVVACNSLLDHLVHLPSDDAIAAAVQLLDYMETQPSHIIQPIELSYIQVLCGIERRIWGDPSLTARYRRTVIEKMKQHRRWLTRPVATRNVIMACFEHPGPEGVRRAMMYYERYRKDRVRSDLKFDITVWGTLLARLLSRKEWAIADELSREILASGQMLPPGLVQLLTRVSDRVSDDKFI